MKKIFSFVSLQIQQVQKAGEKLVKIAEYIKANRNHDGSRRKKQTKQCLSTTLASSENITH